MKYHLVHQNDNNYSILEQIFINRGFNLEDIGHYLNTTEDDIHDPWLLDNIDVALELLLKHLKRPNCKIYCITDCDYDGNSSTALFLNYLHRLFPSIVENNFIYDIHETKIHGIEIDKVPKDTTLVVAIDSSSNQYDVHEELAKRGIDVLVVDHHIAEKKPPYAIVVNNQLDNYPNKTLCGAGVCFKFLQAIDRKLNQNIADDYRDLVATAEIADMMDIRDFETRHLIKTGLEKINNPFLKAMIAKNAIKIPEVNNLAIAFYVVPYVNAVCRTGTVEEKKLLFESMLEWKAYEKVPSTKRGAKLIEKEILVEQAVRICANVKARQTRQKNKLAETLEKKIQNENLLEHKILTICSEESYDGLAGLICNEYVAKYKRPTLLLSRNENDYVGSVRGYEKSELKNFKDFLENSPYINWVQGHQNAAGCSISCNKIDDFIKWADESLKDIDFSEEYLVDFIADGNKFNPNFIYDVCNLNSIYGQNMDEPLVAITNLKITKDNLQLLSRDKNPTIKINLPNGVCLMKFKSNEEEYEQLYSESGCTIIDIIAKCNINEYQGKTTPQLFIESYNITSRQEYYF